MSIFVYIYLFIYLFFVLVEVESVVGREVGDGIQVYLRRAESAEEPAQVSRLWSQVYESELGLSQFLKMRILWCLLTVNINMILIISSYHSV